MLFGCQWNHTRNERHPTNECTLQKWARPFLKVIQTFTKKMKQDFKDQNRILRDADARRRLSLKHLKYLSGYFILIVVLTILSHLDVMIKNENVFEMSQFFCIAICLLALPPSFYAIAQLRRIAKVEKTKEKSEQPDGGYQS